MRARPVDTNDFFLFGQVDELEKDGVGAGNFLSFFGLFQFGMSFEKVTFGGGVGKGKEGFTEINDFLAFLLADYFPEDFIESHKVVAQLGSKPVFGGI